MSFVCPQFECQTLLFDALMGFYPVQPLQVRVNPGAMEIEGYSTFANAPKWSVTIRCFLLSNAVHSLGVFLLFRDALNVFYTPTDLLETYNSMQTNNYYQIEIITWNRKIKLFASDNKMWWSHITVQNTHKKQLYKKCE